MAEDEVVAQVSFFLFFLSWLDVLHHWEYNCVFHRCICVFLVEAHLSFFLSCVDVLHHAWSMAMLPVGAQLCCRWEDTSFVFPFMVWLCSITKSTLALSVREHSCLPVGMQMHFSREHTCAMQGERTEATLLPTNPERRKLFVLTAMVPLGSFYSQTLAWHSRKPQRHGVASLTCGPAACILSLACWAFVV